MIGLPNGRDPAAILEAALKFSDIHRHPPEPRLYASRARSDHFAGFCENMVQAAAENTNTFATMTGDALMSTP